MGGKRVVALTGLGIFLLLGAGSLASAQEVPAASANGGGDRAAAAEPGAEAAAAVDCANKAGSLALSFSEAGVPVGIMVVEAGAPLTFQNGSAQTSCEVSSAPEGILWEAAFVVRPREERQAFAAQAEAEPLAGFVRVVCGESRGTRLLVVCPR